MGQIFFTVLFALVLAVTVWSMHRLRRSLILHQLAAVTRRQIPLQNWMAHIGPVRGGTGEEKTIARLYQFISSGNSLSTALRRARVLSPQQAVALDLAQERGVADRVLAQFAAQAAQIQQIHASTFVMLLYPFLIGAGLLFTSSFIYVFLLPKFDLMLREMGVVAFDPPSLLYFLLIGSLFVWGMFNISLHIPKIWWRVPVVGMHVRVAAQAAFARTLGVMLGSGVTLEDALEALSLAGGGGYLQQPIERIHDAVSDGEPMLEAFKRSGVWRAEILWALDAVTHGAPPQACLEQVADVLDGKARARMQSIYRCGFLTSLLISAFGAGLLAFQIFDAITAIQRALI